MQSVLIWTKRKIYPRAIFALLGTHPRYGYLAVSDSSLLVKTVSYSSRVVQKLSDIVETLNISFGAAIKKGTVEVSGNSSTVDENKIKESDLNVIVSVKARKPL